MSHQAQPPPPEADTRAFLGLGSNLGDRRSYLQQAVLSLASPQIDLASAQIDLVAVSPVYETEPIGGPSQGAYLNIVVEVRTSYAPFDLLKRCLDTEQSAGRIRKERWGPRTLDIDVLWMDGVSLSQERLTIPHPRMRQRRFVMIPLGDLAPEFLDGWQDPQDGAIVNVGELFEMPWPQVKQGLGTDAPAEAWLGQPGRLND